MRKDREKILSSLIFPLVMIGGIVIAWIICAYNIGSEFILPEPSLVFEKMWELLRGKVFYVAYFNTLKRMLVSFVVPGVVALALSGICIVYPPINKGVEILLSILRTLPTMAIVLIVVLWTTREVTPIIICQLVIIPNLYTSIMTSYHNIDLPLREVEKIFNRGGGFYALKKVYIPLTLPYILPQMGANLALTLKIMVASEVVASTAKSLGGMMNLANLYFEMAELLALTFFVVITGVVLELVFKGFTFLYKKSLS